MGPDGWPALPACLSVDVAILQCHSFPPRLICLLSADVSRRTNTSTSREENRGTFWFKAGIAPLHSCRLPLFSLVLPTKALFPPRLHIPSQSTAVKPCPPGVHPSLSLSSRFFGPCQPLSIQQQVPNNSRNKTARRISRRTLFIPLLRSFSSPSFHPLAYDPSLFFTRSLLSLNQPTQIRLSSSCPICHLSRTTRCFLTWLPIENCEWRSGSRSERLPCLGR